MPVDVMYLASKEIRFLQPGASQAKSGFLTDSSATLQPPLPGNVWGAWNWDLLLIAGLLLGLAFYVRGVRRLWRSASAGRGVSVWQVVAFAAGWLALVVALVSPLEALSEALLAAHMVQHLLLMLVAAPLLVVGAPPVVLAWAIGDAGPLRAAAVGRWWRRRATLRRLWRAIFRRPLAWLAFNAVLWLWHVPALYEAAILDEGVHIFEHATFLLAALFFWATLVHGTHGSAVRRPSSAVAPLYVFTTALLSGLLGVLLTFSQSVWYPVYGVVPYGWGVTPLQDQQLAGVIMWFPGGLIYLAAMLILLRRMLLPNALQSRAGKGADARAVIAPRRDVETEFEIGHASARSSVYE